MRMLLVAVREHCNDFLSDFLSLSVFECCTCVSLSRRFAYDLPVHRATVLTIVTACCLTHGCIPILSTNSERTGTWDPWCAVRNNRHMLLSSKNLSFKNIPAKLQKKLVGQFEVIEKVGPQAYCLDLPDTWKIHNVFHISLQKRWKTSVYKETEDETAVELNIEERKTNVIKKILRWKKTGRGQPAAYLIL